ncbi:hypothetical protein O181_013531 [Austropuccinia psidii MF-1]|uniref:Uncharacterized protein n=1 Tax=Austropuccinia psidii MF-1 TaxID=1389203 RepID=A0A9Q3GNB0_9BASI|nr:hypothetical protein [Austropuccinia psidii MF-1]
MGEKKLKNSTRAGLIKEDESKGIKSMSENPEIMYPFYAKMDAFFGHMTNATPIARYYIQDKDSLNGDDDDDLLLNRENNFLESPLNLDPFLNNEDILVQVENLQDESATTSKPDTYEIQYWLFLLLPEN